MSEDTKDLTPQQKAAITRAKNKAIKEDEVITDVDNLVDNLVDEVVTEVSGPITKTFGVVRKKDGWYTVATAMADGKLLDVEETGPLMRAIAVEEFKITAQRHLDGLE